MATPPDDPGPQPPSVPTWVKLLGVAVAIVVVVMVVLAVAGGNHGPGRHLPGGRDAGHTPPLQNSR